ncbi:hypothetical protein GEMRC1_007846 [Eukaryota sp. GEM-RC1]
MDQLTPSCFIIDTLPASPKHFASFLVQSSDRSSYAIIETSTHKASMNTLQTLHVHEIPFDRISLIIPTHVHLDHAGGCGLLSAHFPNAKVAAHAAGVKHLVDPSQLNAAARSVYSDQVMDESVGESIPISSDKVISLQDNQLLNVGDLQLQCIYTHGHAYHHMCVYDCTNKALYAGDALGSLYDVDGQSFLVLGSAPTQFDPSVWNESIDRIRGLEISTVFLTHFGAVSDVEWLIQSISDLIKEHDDIARTNETDDIPQALTDFL